MFWRSLLFRLFGKSMKRRAVAADTLEGILKVGARLRQEGFQVTYDLMVEGLTAAKDVRKACESLERLIGAMSDENEGNVAIKPTMFGLALDHPEYVREEIFLSHLEIILRGITRSPLKGIAIEIDAEDASTVASAFRTVMKLRDRHPQHADKLRTAIQMHLAALSSHDREFDLLSRPVRLVKGAGVYEKDAHLPRISDGNVIPRMIECFRRSVKAGQRPFVATAEDDEGTERILRFAKMNGIPQNAFEIQMLLGFGTKLARRWRDRGYTVRIYCPYVLPWCEDRWMPYVERRFPMVWKNTLRKVKRSFVRLLPSFWKPPV